MSQTNPSAITSQDCQETPSTDNRLPPSCLLSLEQSAKIAGVSEETIEQYSTFGLLEKINRDGQIGFLESDIRSLFYTRQNGVPAVSTTTGSTATGSTTIGPVSAAEEAKQETVGGNVATTENPKVETSSSASKPSVLPRPNPTSDSEVPTLESILRPDPIDQLRGDQLHGERFGELPEQGENTDSSVGVKPDSEQECRGQQDFTSGPAASVQHPLPTLPSQELGEVNKSLRQQIEMLQEERNWLRQRVERLEQRSEREQMLLLSENETVRRLITIREDQHSDKKSFWKLALPWFGSNSDR